MEKLLSRRKKRVETSGTLGERISFAFFSGMLALLLASVLWMLLHFRYGIVHHTIPFEYVLYFPA